MSPSRVFPRFADFPGTGAGHVGADEVALHAIPRWGYAVNGRKEPNSVRLVPGNQVARRGQRPTNLVVRPADDDNPAAAIPDGMGAEHIGANEIGLNEASGQAPGHRAGTGATDDGDRNLREAQVE